MCGHKVQLLCCVEVTANHLTCVRLCPKISVPESQHFTLAVCSLNEKKNPSGMTARLSYTLLHATSLRRESTLESALVVC